MSVCTECIVAKRCVLEEQKLLLTYRNYEKSIGYKMNDLDLLEVVSRSCQPLRYIWRWISRKRLKIETWFQEMAWGIKRSRDRVTSRDLERSNSWFSNNWGSYSDSLASCYIVIFIRLLSRTPQVWNKLSSSSVQIYLQQINFTEYAIMDNWYSRRNSQAISF